MKLNPHLQAWSVNADDFPTHGFASDQLEFLLGYAVLAPSPRNTQPWLFRINAMDVELFADRRRALPVVDPDQRELVISCGAALFNLRVAAEYFGHSYKVELCPDSNTPELLARFHLGLNGETSSENVALFHAIPQRRTNCQPFTEAPLPSALLEALAAAAQAEGAWLQAIDGDPARTVVADLVAEADRAQWADRSFRAELAAWVRPKPEESLDGLPTSRFGVKDWLSFAGATMIRTLNRGADAATRDRELALRSPVLAVLGVDTDDVGTWLRAGQALQRVLLTARAEEVWASCFSPPTELPESRARLAEIAGRGGCPQVLLRLGYGPAVQPTPRRSVRALLIRHTNALRLGVSAVNGFST